MNVLTYGEIMEGGASVFHCVVREDAGSLFVTFSVSLCTIHHRAFDEDLVGISPDYEVRVAWR